MSVTSDLYEKWKSRKGLASDRQACAKLGVSHALPGAWRKGGNSTADIVAKMARDLGHEDFEIAALIFEATAESQSANAAASRALLRMAKAMRDLHEAK